MRNLSFYSNITKYQSEPSFSSLMILRDDTGQLIRESSDIEYILGSTYNDNATAIEVIRQYLVSNTAVSSNIDVSNLSSEDIMNLVPPRSINTLTDAYQYSKYLEQNSSYIKKKVDEYKKFIKEQNQD